MTIQAPETNGATSIDKAISTARQFAPLLKAIADEHRLAILLLLAQKPMSVVEMTKLLGISQTLVSHHLKGLRDAGLVAARPIGRSNVYSMCCEAVAEPVRYLAGVATAAQRAREPEE